MAQYKVPQDVEADDKLIGPFSFRQFVYLLIVAGLVAIAVFLAQIFIALAIIPLPLILLFGALALPLRKDQPMETYLSAIVSFYLKPRKRIWTPGQRESTIEITAPKVAEEARTRNISGEEATHRLSFLADIVDSQGRSINDNSVRDDFVAEANATEDMFDSYRSSRLNNAIERDERSRHDEIINEMRSAFQATAQQEFEQTNIEPGHNTISRNFAAAAAPAVPTVDLGAYQQPPQPTPPPSIYDSPAIVRPGEPEPIPEPVAVPTPAVPIPEKTTSAKPPKPGIIELANNPDLSVATIAEEAKRIKGKDNGEVFISLH